MIRRSLCRFAFVWGLNVSAFAQSQTLPAELSQEGKRRVFTSCYEVVVPKPENDPLSYEKELPWSQLPYNIRNDKFYSVGTAFAVSPKELLTAFHVLDLDKKSAIFSKVFIRDQEQNVYELDQILAADQARDVVRFTVKGKALPAWLPMHPSYELNQPAYTVGNAYGEGLVLRRGDLIGTLPEAESGQWKLLRSSADVNAGNSGGPLVDTFGRVIGIVLARKDNISLSLPVSEIQAMKNGVASFHRKISYGFSLVPERIEGVVDDFQIALPKTYESLITEALTPARAHYVKRMEELFAMAKDQYFPRGEASLEAIHHIPTSTGLEFLFKDANTKKWVFSALKYNSYEAGGEARIHIANSNNLVFSIVQPPKPEDLPGMLDHPKDLMDLFLKGINYTRDIGGQRTRITSLGDPCREEDVVDGLGRPWKVKFWLIPHLNQYVIAYIAPVPQGAAVIIKEVGTWDAEEWLYDMRRILDLIYVPYSGTVKQWNTFLALPKNLLPPALLPTRLVFEAGKELRVDAPWLSFQVAANEMEIDSDMRFGLFMGFVSKGRETAWELRRVVVSEADEDTYFSLLRHLKPGVNMADAYQKSWREILKRKHPYTATAFSEEGGTRIATVLELGRRPSQNPEDVDSLYTLYFAKTGTVSERQMKAKLKHLAESHHLPLSSAGPVLSGGKD